MSDDTGGKPSTFSHLDEQGTLSMVDVGAKEITRREATASCRVTMSKATIELLVAPALPKGDVLTTAKVAGILAAKQTSALIPLTHPLSINYVDVEFDVRPEERTIEVRATVRCEGRTGVEIEAMTACAIASLTIYDMCKSVEKEIVINELRLLRKSGGKSGTFERMKDER